MSKADSFVDNTSVVFIVLGILGVLYYGILVFFFGWVVDPMRTLTSELMRQMPSWKRFWVDHMSLIFIFHAILSAGYAMGAMGMMKRKRWALRFFLACLLVDLMTKTIKVFWVVFWLFGERTQWEEGLFASSPLFMVRSQIFSLVFGFAVLAVLVWLWVRFRRQVVRDLFE